MFVEEGHSGLAGLEGNQRDVPLLMPLVAASDHYSVNFSCEKYRLTSSNAAATSVFNEHSSAIEVNGAFQLAGGASRNGGSGCVFRLEKV